MFKFGRFALTVLASVFFIYTSAQVNIAGKVLDASTRQPLVNASVYCENTTMFTVTGHDGGFSLSLSPGGYNLIVSFIGYKTYYIQVTGSDEKMLILLKREDIEMKEVVVTAKSKLDEDGWNKYGLYFIKNFIGTTPNAADCRLLNPEVLRFYYFGETNKIKVYAKAPLRISNAALGYTLSYELDSFVCYFDDNICSYQGYSRYTPMQGNEGQEKKWKRNRQKAYEGSVLHFMRSYYLGTLVSDGWEVALQQENDATKFYLLTNPFDGKYFQRDAVNELVKIQFPRIIRVTYAKKRPEPEYLTQFQVARKINGLLSLIDLKDKITIMENGYYHHPLSWVSYNYWSWKNMADMLPYDYNPEEIEQGK